MCVLTHTWFVEYIHVCVCTSYDYVPVSLRWLPTRGESQVPLLSMQQACFTFAMSPTKPSVSFGSVWAVVTGWPVANLLIS